MRKFLVILSVWLGLTAGLQAADTFTLTDGTTVNGDIVKFDDYNAMIRTTEDNYTNITWPRFSQDTLKQLAANSKFKALAEPFIAPVPATPATLKTTPSVTRSLPAPDKLHPALIAGLLHSSLGLFLLLVIYAANLFAAFEIALFRAKAPGVVLAVSAILPVVGPILFLALRTEITSAVETAPQEPAEAPAHGASGTAPAATPPPRSAPRSPTPDPAAAHTEVSGSRPDDEPPTSSWSITADQKKPEPQVFARGKFTFNKRFIETKFAGFVGDPTGDARNFSMEIKTAKGILFVEIIKQTAQTEAIVETPQGQVTLAYSEILEIKLIPKPA